ncbi:MAG: hypothetical protein E7493_13520 [Ruminococcus albus]|nr:hypothetical protein [Ruminococcus albus]
MDYKDIRHTAAKRLALNSGDCVSLMVFQFSLAALLVLCESTLYLSLRSMGHTWLYSRAELLAGRNSTWLFWISKTIVEFALIASCFGLARRLFLDVAIGNRMSETKMYISAHSVSFYSGAFYASLIQLFIKLTVITPGLLTSYGIYYWAREITLNELTSGALFALTACLSMTAVWTFVSVRFFISLALTPYIMALNPRANIFDACDQSVKMMEGRHMRYLSFLFYFVRFVPAMLLVYPFFLVYPYFKVSYALFMSEMLGEKNNDRLPGMIKRWKKYQ